MSRDIVLVHGGGQGSWIWDKTVAAIRLVAADEVGRVIALDVPGCGAKRERDTSGLSTPEVIAELIAELEAMHVQDSLLVGHSMAGTLLPGMIVAAPSRFARAVYFTCAAPAQGQTIGQMMGNRRQGDDEAAVGWPVDPASTTPTELFRAAFCNDMDPETSDRFLGRLFQDNWPAACGDSWAQWEYGAARSIPATYVIALADRILPVPWQRCFAERLHAERIRYLDSGHQGMNTCPFSLAEILITEARHGT